MSGSQPNPPATMARSESSGASSASAVSVPLVQQPVKALLLLISGLFVLACMDSTIKYLTTFYNVPLVVAVRYSVHCLLMIVLLAPHQGKRLVRTQRTGLVLIRGICLAAASLFMGMALQRMPVAETTAINFLGPMLVVLLARPLLHERIGALGWAAALTGFGGVLLIARPGGGLDPTGVVFALGAVGANASYQLLSRVLVTTEQTLALLFYAALTGAIGFGIALPWFWEGTPPTPWQLLLFLSMGITAGLGHYLFTLAYRYAPASLLAPANYLQLLWAGLLGWLIFGHIPDPLSILGMGVVAASGLMIAFKSRLSN